MEEYGPNKAVDTVWQPLQKKDRWYAGVEKVAFQSGSYSDIVGQTSLNKCMRTIT